MAKLRRMYSDFVTGETRQNDTLQETLINVITGYVVQNYLGSYGPMSFPVAACASAAVSVGDALDKIATGQADLVVTGGVDDYSFEGAIGFGDMKATASSDELLALGIEPSRMSRPNDRRRRGFVEGQGAGAQILARASVAMRLGLPVYGIIAHASAHGDGINLSVPAPGIGVLSVAAETETHAASDACDFAGRRAQTLAIAAEQKKLAALLGEREATQMIADARARYAHDFARNDDRVSPLRAALAVFGLGPDDIALVSKHDTSTAMNDLNENRLHHLLQEKLGRTPHLPLAVISQKALTGHGKGAAAAWQLNGVLQAMAEGVIPGNASLDDVDDDMRAFTPLTFTDSALKTPDLRAALITSLGFGHVGAIVCVLHPFFFWRMLAGHERDDYAKRLGARVSAADQRLRAVLSGHTPLVARRTHRPFSHRDGSAAQIAEEAAMLTNAAARARDGSFSQEPL
jgi:3-oxoacyl-(acyl-carrier-protein) synthase